MRLSGGLAVGLDDLNDGADAKDLATYRLT